MQYMDNELFLKKSCKCRLSTRTLRVFAISEKHNRAIFNRWISSAGYSSAWNRCIFSSLHA